MMGADVNLFGIAAVRDALDLHAHQDVLTGWQLHFHAAHDNRALPFADVTEDQRRH